MKLLILGASGGCGRWCTTLAVERGHEVTVLTRPTASMAPDCGARILQGDPLDRVTLRSAPEGMDAVLCCIGIRRANPLNPWSRIVSPTNLVTQMAANLSAILPEAEVKRLILISAAGVGESAARTSAVNRWLFSHSNIGVAYQDLETAEQTLARSTLDWMAVRPTTLANGRPRGAGKIVGYYGLTTRIRRSEVAAFMLNAVETPAPFQQRTPMLAG